MKTVEIKIGQEVPFDLSKLKFSWLSSLVKSDESVVTKKRPTFPSEIDPSKKFTINHNYDGMIGTIVYDPETKTIKGSGYGWETMIYNFE